MGQGWQELRCPGHRPAGQAHGLPKTVVPLWPPRSRPFNWPFGSCPWPPWAESRLRPLTSQFFLSISVTQGLGTAPTFRGNLGQTGLVGESRNLLPRELPWGPGALGPGL